MDPLAEVKLKNGSTESRLLVNATMLTLKGMSDTLPGVLAFCDLVAYCRKNRVPTSNSTNMLVESELMRPDGTVHESIRNVVLSAAQGEGMELSLVSPVME
jgi:hypothetical protein